VVGAGRSARISLYSRTEVLGVGRDGDQGFGGGFEQQVIDDRFVVVGDVGPIAVIEGATRRER
jgi:hypothetical protein